MSHTVDTEKILSSLAAMGATLLTAGALQAGTIDLISNVNVDVSQTNGVPSASFTLALPGNDSFVIQAGHSQTGRHGKKFRYISMNPVVHGYGQLRTQVAGPWNVMVPAGSNQKWSSMAGSASSNGVLAGVSSLKSHGAFAANYTDAYFGFVFKDTTMNQFDYGWIEVSLITESFSTQDVRIISYAWDPTGQQLATPQNPTPEPNSGPLGALAIGAMMLGAAGVRRWKAAKSQETVN